MDKNSANSPRPPMIFEKHEWTSSDFPVPADREHDHDIEKQLYFRESIMTQSRRRRLDERAERLSNTCKRDTLLSLTENFYGGNWRGEDLWPVVDGIVKCSKDQPTAVAAASSAISHLNNSNEGMDLGFVEIVRANVLFCAGKVYYLTIKASDNNIYEAEIYKPTRADFEVKFIRPAIHYPVVNPEFLKYDAPADTD